MYQDLDVAFVMEGWLLLLAAFFCYQEQAIFEKKLLFHLPIHWLALYNKYALQNKTSVPLLDDR